MQTRKEKKHVNNKQLAEIAKSNTVLEVTCIADDLYVVEYVPNDTTTVNVTTNDDEQPKSTKKRNKKEE